MNAGIGFLKVDVVVQRILILILLISGVFGFFIPSLFIIALLALLAIGGWQVLSSIIFSINGNDRRVTYLIAVACFAILAVVGYTLIERRIIKESFLLFIVSLVIIPMIMAAWYHVITIRHYDEIVRNPRIDTGLNLEMEDVLDSEELY